MRTRAFFAIAIVILTIIATSTEGRAQSQNKVVTTPPVSVVEGKNRVAPATGTSGHGAGFNFLPYIVPGEYSDPADNTIKNDPFDIAYVNRNQPVQTSDWWTGIGLQWQGWVVARSAPEGEVGRSTPFISEPFQMQFVDFGIGPGNANIIPGIPLRIHGLRFWNQNAITVKTNGKITPTDPFDPSVNFAGRGNNSRENSPIVTVGLANVHPLGLAVPVKAPWSNVKVKSYSDWGVVLSYADAGSEMTITVANGSPIVWLERTAGNATFTAWAGEREPAGGRTVWFNEGGIIGVTVTNLYNPFNGAPQASSTASYVLIADTGAWTETQASGNVAVSMFQNAAATRVAVLAIPHNVSPTDALALATAMNNLKQYACVKIVDTKVHYPPIPGSDTTVQLGGETLSLGYDQAASIIRSKMQVTTVPFPLQGCTEGQAPLQIVFPHHRKTMHPNSRQNILSQYTWNGVIGEFQGFRGSFYVRELRARGLLPFLPSVAVNSALQNPLQGGQAAVDDIYNTFKQWFFVEEPIPANNDGSQPHLNSVLRNLGTYMGVQDNSYIQSVAALYEAMVIADQLAQSTQLRGDDPDFGTRTKTDVAGEMRDNLLIMLKELIGRWADVYTAQFFVYNTDYQSIFGTPEGYGATQNFNDHHFHYGYFLKAAAAIGRYDPDWLKAYLPLIDKLRRDVATFDRSDTQFPFLREFSPFYGHSWANGTSDAGGQDQESTSEAINFAVGLFELGQVVDNKAWRDIGVYLFEEEILATEQYWFNQDADLSRPSSNFYNGNWPSALVHFTGPDNTQWKTTLVTNVKQFGVFRNTFFGGIQGSYAIQAIPMSAFTVYLGRNQNWLNETWKQYLLDTRDQPASIYDVVIASLQARLPFTGTTVNDTGLTGALRRITNLHLHFPATMNTHGKYFAYTHAQLGLVEPQVVADIPSYGVFRAGTRRTYVAYNPSATQVTVAFTDTISNQKFGLVVPAGSMAWQTVGGNSGVDRLTPFKEDPNKLFLRSGGTLSKAAGTFVLPAGETTFPSDSSALQTSLVTVPIRPDGKDPLATPLVLPPPDSIRTWTGKFSGYLTGGSKPLTRFSVYTNQILVPGWQQDQPKAPNGLTARFNYDFNSDGVIDRVEILQNVPVFHGNAFLYGSKVTEYYFDGIYGGTIGRIALFVGDGKGGGTAPFPVRVTDGTVSLQIYGASGPQPVFPIPVSVDAAPITNRASWIKPPYAPLPMGVPLPDLPTSCTTVCLSAPGYYLLRLNRLPRGTVLISGVNANAPVSTGDRNRMKLALDGGPSARDKFNAQFVSVQLSLLASAAPDQSALVSVLGCYGIHLPSITLSNGAILTQDSPLSHLMEQARWVARSGQTSDFEKLGDFLDLLVRDDTGDRCSPEEPPVNPPN